MPTHVNPDDPNATGAARLQSMVGGARDPGSPPPGGHPPPAPPRAPAPPPPSTPGPPQPAPGAGSQKTTGVGAPAAPAPPALDAAGGAATQTFTSATIPPQGSVLPGSQVQTPLGTVSAGPDGSQRLALDANGQQKDKESLAALRSKFAVPKVMKGMQGLPA